jgi:hypothetical protein
MSSNYGWICPRCSRVNAPWKETCDCSPAIWNYEVFPSGPVYPPNPVPTTNGPLPAPSFYHCNTTEDPHIAQIMHPQQTILYPHHNTTKEVK